MPRDETDVAWRPSGGERHAFGIASDVAESYCGNLKMPTDEYDREMESRPLGLTTLDDVTCKACRRILNLSRRD